MITAHYGFMPDRRTRNAVIVLRRLVERSIKDKKHVYVCFIDCSKAFDTVKPLIELQQSLDTDTQDISCLPTYTGIKKATVRQNGELSESINIMQGVRR